MKIKEILIQAKQTLNKNQIEDSYLIARRLLAYILKIDRYEIIVKENEEIDENQRVKYEDLIQKIIQGEPIQYLIHEQEFMKLPFYLEESVLIPQPDTETLVEEVLNIAQKQQLEILDICTGSGCIGISLAYYLKNVKVTLSDISKEAINIAEINVQKNGVEEKIQIVQSDLFEKIEGKFDIIVSNPPYIRTEVIKTLEKQVQKEPHIALDGGKDGLDFYRILINQAPKYLKQNGVLCLEIGFDQKQEVVNLAKQNNNYKKIETKKDIAGNDRVVICYI